MPYRSRKDSRAPEREEVGLVADMVRQFADPYAFVRELIQNGIDAGARELEVRAELGDGGTALFSVRDDGEGMTREIIEGPLLTLFSSAKDGDPDKIGKYGVGFVSVFALEPHQVIVETWRPEASWRLTLLPDHSYELAAGRPREGSGTEVTLLRPLSPEEYDEHAGRVQGALLRWCRHAGVPIHWVMRRGASTTRERVDRPLDVVAVVTVRSDADGASIVVGPSAGEDDEARIERSETFAGFYNRGLTLHESTQAQDPMLAGVRLKAMSSTLQHTLSRDNVRHDDAYRRVVRQAVDLVRGPLAERVTEELAAAAERVTEELVVTAEGRLSAGGWADHYAALLAAAARRPLRLSRRKLAIALCDAVDGARVCQARACPWRKGLVLWSAKPDAVTAALAARSVRVALAPSDRVREALSLVFGKDTAEVGSLFSALEPAEHDERAKALCRHTLRGLEAAGEPVRSVGLADVHGPAERAAVGHDEKGTLLLERGAWPGWRPWFGKARLRLVRSHAAVERALAMAEHDARTAGTLLARYLVVEARGEVGRGPSAAILEAGAPGRRS